MAPVEENDGVPRPAVERDTPTRVVPARKPTPVPMPAPGPARRTLKDADAAPAPADEPDPRETREAARAEREAANLAAREARERARAERDAADAAERAERDAARETAKAGQAAAKETERTEQAAAKERERAERDAAKEAERAERQAAKDDAAAEKAAAKIAAENERREAALAAKAEKEAARDADRAAKEAAREADRAAKEAAREADRAAKVAAKEAKRAEKAAAKAARKPRRDLRPNPFPVISASDWEKPAEAATTLFKRAEFTATEAVDWYLRHKRSRKRASRLLRALAILLVAAGMLMPLLAPVVAQVRSEYGYALFALAASCVAFDHFFGLSSGWMRDVVTAQALHSRLEALRFDWAAECARSALTTRRTMDEVDRQLTLLREFSDDIVALTTAETAEWMAEFRLSVTSAKQRLAARPQPRRAGAHATERQS